MQYSLDMVSRAAMTISVGGEKLTFIETLGYAAETHTKCAEGEVPIKDLTRAFPDRLSGH